MTLIFCTEKCVHQSEGYCTLSAAAAVTDVTAKGCIHQEKPTVPSLSLSRPVRKQLL